MKMHRVSFVEHWRKWRDDEDSTLEELFSNVESEAMRAGTAFHKAIELAAPGEHDRIEANGYAFDVPGEILLSSSGLKEVRLCKAYLVDGKPVTITGQVDEIHGRQVVDHKTTARFDPDRFLSGYQWRFYLDIFGADIFRWNVFEIAEVGDRQYEVRAHHRLEQYRYPGLGRDCQQLVGEFARFIRSVESELV